MNPLVQDVECKDESSAHQVQGPHKFEKYYVNEFHLLWISLKLWTCLKSLTPTHWSVEQCPHCKECKVAMQEEYKSLMQNYTWTLTNLPMRRKHV